jgi:hypothetical protein
VASDSSGEAGVEPIVVELDPVIAELGTSRHLSIPTESGREHSVTVTVPPGVEDGTLLRLPGKGGPGPTGGPPRDLLIRIRVKSFVPEVAPDSWTAAGRSGPTGKTRPSNPPVATPPRPRRSRRSTILQLRTAAATVASADPSQKYRVGRFMPPRQADRDQRLGNRSVITAPAAG